MGASPRQSGGRAAEPEDLKRAPSPEAQVLHLSSITCEKPCVNLKAQLVHPQLLKAP